MQACAVPAGITGATLSEPTVNPLAQAAERAQSPETRARRSISCAARVANWARKLYSQDITNGQPYVKFALCAATMRGVARV